MLILQRAMNKMSKALSKTISAGFVFFGIIQLLLFPCSVSATDYTLNSANFSQIMNDLNGTYHLLENITPNSDELPMSSPEGLFRGQLDAHYFTIHNFEITDENNDGGLFMALGDGAEVINLVIENGDVFSKNGGLIAGETGDNCNIQVIAMRHSLVNCAGAPCGVLVGRSGANNNIRLLYSDGHSIHGSGEAAGLVGIAGENNILSLGYSTTDVIGDRVAGVSFAGSNSQIILSVIRSRLISRNSSSYPVGAGDSIQCNLNFWSLSTALTTSLSGCNATGLSDSDLMAANPDSSFISQQEKESFRFGNNRQFLYAVEHGAKLAQLDGPECSTIACQPRTCDNWQSDPIFQEFDSQSRRYIISLEGLNNQVENDRPLMFRVTRLTPSNRLDSSFGDAGIIRYPYTLSTDDLTSLSSVEGLLLDHNVYLIGKNQNDQPRIVKLNVDHRHRERGYQLFSPGLAGEPKLLTHFGHSLYVVTARTLDNVSTRFRLYRMINIQDLTATQELYDFATPHPEPLAYALESQAVLHVAAESGNNGVSVFRINLLDQSDITELESMPLIDDPKIVRLFFRAAGLWLIQVNTEDDYSIELFDTNNQAADDNSTMTYVYNDTGLAVDGSLFIPDDSEEPVIYRAYLSGRCLVFEDSLETTVTVPSLGALTPLYNLLYDMFSAIIVYLRQLTLLYGRAASHLN